MTTSTTRARTDARPLAGYRHPSPAAYCAGCRCAPCLHARYRYAKGYRTRVAANGPALIDAVEARVHLQTLLGAGYSPTVIAAVALVDRTTIVNIVEGRHQATSRTAVERLVATTAAGILAHAPGAMRVPAIGTARRVRALQALGWSIAHIAEAAERSAAGLEWAVAHPDGVLPTSAHRAIRDVYDQLSMRLGPSHRTAAYAKRAGWAPPLAWDDDEIDDPSAEPRNPADPENRAVERDETISDLTNAGKSARHIAETVGCSDRTVVRVRQRVRAAA